MTIEVGAVDIFAPSPTQLDAVSAYFTEYPVGPFDIVAVDGVTGQANVGNVLGASDAAVWEFDAGATDPGGGAVPLWLAIIEPDTIEAAPGSRLSFPTVLDVDLGDDTAPGDLSGLFVLVLDADSGAVLDMASAPTVAGAQTQSLGGLGLAAITAVADGAAVLAVGFLSTADGTTSTYAVDSFLLTIPEAVGGPVSSNTHAQSANCMLIAVVLSNACEIEENAPVLVTAGVGKITPTVRREDGVDYSAKNFGGVVCGPELIGDTVEKGVDLEGEFCLVDWSFQSLTTGNPKIVNGDGHTIGYQQLKRTANACDPTLRKPHLALTVIRAAATSDGGCVGDASSATGATNAVAHTYPNTYDWVWDIPANEDARALVPFKCKGGTSPNPGRGPMNLYPAGATPERIETDAFYVPYFVDPAALPDVTPDEMQSHPAPLGKIGD